MSEARATHLDAPAKLNLGLRVVGRRSDGFHDLDSLFVRLDLGDHLRMWPIEAVGGGAGDRSGGGDELVRRPSGDAWIDGRSLDLGGDNLVMRALSCYRRAARSLAVQLPPVAVELTKRVPWGAGLAGGSADAAAALRGASALAPADVDLGALAAELGSDVPFCLAGVSAAHVRGRGERMAPLDLPPLDVVLVYPGVAVPTGPAFSWWGEEPVDVPPPAVAALRAGHRPELANALEGPVAARVPEVAAALAALRSLDVGPVAMSGSGSTCFAVTNDASVALAAAAVLARRHPGWWVRAARAGV